MFPNRPGVDKKAALVAQAKAERLARSGQKKIEEQNALQERSSLRIQKFWRRLRARHVVKDRQRTDWDVMAAQLPSTPTLGLVRNLQLTFLLLRFYDPVACPMDSRRLSTLCKLLLSKTIIAADEGSFSTTAANITSNGSSSSPSPTPPAPSAAGAAASATKEDQKPLMQVPFQMILLHARYADLATTAVQCLLQLCIGAVMGNRVDASGKPSPAISTIKSALEDDLYLSGPELRFLMAFVDTNTYRLPETVSLAIRTQMSDRGTALIIRILNSGKFYKDVRLGVAPRVKAMLLLQDRAKKTSLTSAETSKQKALSLWMTAIWRCCLLLQSVDKDFKEKLSTPSRGNQHKDNLINLYSDDSTAVGIACYILTIPLFVDTLDDLCLQLAWNSHVLRATSDAILDLRHQQFMLTTMSLNDTLSLLANMTRLYRVNMTKNTEAVNAELKNQLVEVAIVLLTHCQKYVSATQTTEFRQYHPIFSWTVTSQKSQQFSDTQAKSLMVQLEYLWSREFALDTFHALLNLRLPPISADPPPGSVFNNRDTQSPAAGRQGRFSSPLERINNSLSSRPSDPQRTLLAIEIQQACSFYMILMKTFDAQKTKILVTLMYLPSFLSQLWRFMTTLGPKGGMYIYLEAAAGSGRKGLHQEPLIAILQIFCECCARYFITLDDDDMYEQQRTWELSELVFMSGFLNQFCFSILSQQEDMVVSLGSKETAAVTAGSAPPELPSLPPLPPIFYHARQVLMQLYERDCRRAYCPPNHWLLMHPTKGVFHSPLQLLASLTLSNKDRSSSHGSTKSSTTKGGGLFSFSSNKSPPQYATPKEFISKVSQKDRTALQILETMPHVIPFSARLEIFRDFIKEEKLQRAQSLALVRPDLHQSVMVRVRRGYVLEDGYQSLGRISANAWKNTIRVKFVNEGGAAEAGIDQGGPFKEFMESFLETGFSPNLNLFTTSTASMNMLYPSPTSHFTHPTTGLELFRLFGKMLGKAMYEGLLIEVKFANFFLSKILGRTVFLDEMRSYDQQVFQNLMFLKKYEGDVEDLGLTFSLDEEIFGTHRTIEFMRGGKDIAVTKDNRINYIFKMSDYRLNKQIQEQSKAFIEGFRSIIPLHWISMFSPQELHRVMAGEDVDFEYQNGYFDQHPVIRNLWSALNEFSSEEKRAFLKFVTSCSKPPLGGFKYLHPPFSIRLVMDPNTSDSNHNGAPANGPRQFGSGAHMPSRNGTTGGGGGGLGSRLRSAFNVNNSNNGNNDSSNGFSVNASSISSSSSSSSSLVSRSNQSSSTSGLSPFALTTDEHGTPAALGVVKSFFGGVLGNAGSSSESTGKKARLPTSSTCFNLLKLPPFSSKSVLKEKLRYAITSNTGFELS
ncbi:Ubiquitin-protein ligase E3B [Gamsiella multidivaricata]|nr:Ubiquitin-protein ligase E3B [Gamsiella multidivaricata]